MLSDNVLALVNNNPSLQSALYDMNLLPEQVSNDQQAGALTYFAAGFALGVGNLKEPE